MMITLPLPDPVMIEARDAGNYVIKDPYSSDHRSQLCMAIPVLRNNLNAQYQFDRTRAEGGPVIILAKFR